MFEKMRNKKTTNRAYKRQNMTRRTKLEKFSENEAICEMAHQIDGRKIDEMFSALYIHTKYKIEWKKDNDCNNSQISAIHLSNELRMSPFLFLSFTISSFRHFTFFRFVFCCSKKAYNQIELDISWSMVKQS